MFLGSEMWDETGQHAQHKGVLGGGQAVVPTLVFGLRTFQFKFSLVTNFVTLGNYYLDFNFPIYKIRIT